MPTFNTQFHVPVPPEEAFAFVTDPDNGTKWAGSPTSVRAEGEPGVGRQIIASVNMVISFEITQTVTAWDPPSHYAFGATSPMTVAYDFRFTPDGEGTSIACTIDVDAGRFLPGGNRLLKGRFRKEFDGDMARLKAVLGG